MYEINVLVNGNRCRQYSHQGKLFIQAKEGSEYSIEIKNNRHRRILAVCSVDGLDILNGKPAKEDNSGYVINGYSVGKFDGFRISDNEVAKFTFDYKSKSYAASKKDGSEANVGVIGIRLFSEKIKQPIIQEHHHHHYPKNNQWPWIDDPYWKPTIWTTPLYGTTDINNYPNHSILRSASNVSPSGHFSRNINNSLTLTSQALNCGPSVNSLKDDASVLNDLQTLRGFDMGTKFGKSKESKVVEVNFERDIITLSTEIYYASRQSLIELGIPLGSEKQVAFPKAFQGSKYATPPQGWIGE